MKNGHGFKDKTVLITGASSGIGAALAQRLSEIGAHVLLTGRDRARLDLVVSQCPGPVATFVGDLTSPETLTSLRNWVSNHPLDLVILNAGTSSYSSPDLFQAKAFHHLMAANLGSMVDCVDIVLPHLLKRGGQLALMSSVAGYAGFSLAPAYCASKAAIRILGQSLDLDFRHMGVPVSVICPGFVATPLTNKNTFAMPFIIPVETAVTRILSGLEKQAHEIHFPKRLSLVMKLLSSLPASWQYWVFRQLAKGSTT